MKASQNTLWILRRFQPQVLGYAQNLLRSKNYGFCIPPSVAELKFASKDGRGIKATMFVLKPYILQGFNTNSQFTSIQGRMLVNRMATERLPVDKLSRLQTPRFFAKLDLIRLWR